MTMERECIVVLIECLIIVWLCCLSFLFTYLTGVSYVLHLELGAVRRAILVTKLLRIISHKEVIRSIVIVVATQTLNTLFVRGG